MDYQRNNVERSNCC